MLKIKDVLNISQGGIIKKLFLEYGDSYAWTANDDIDRAYILEHGERILSPLALALYQESASSFIARAADIVDSVFNNKWTRLYEASRLKYEPIENYSMIEEENTGRDEITDTIAFNNASQYGFNSNYAAPSSTAQGSGGSHVEADFNKNHRKLTRSGNIGVTTSQQMIESEIELWQWVFIRDVVFKDLNELFTLHIY